MGNKTYKGRIESLKENEIFVFGSNTQGRHGKGAAKIAKEKFGAIYGQPSGLQGQSYAIITKDLTKQVHPSVDYVWIRGQIFKLYLFAEQNKQLVFYIAYSGTESNLNGYSNKQMAHMFALKDMEIPSNIIFEEEFYKLIEEDGKDS